MLDLTDVIVAAFEVDVLYGDAFAGGLIEGAVDYAEGAAWEKLLAIALSQPLEYTLPSSSSIW